ncbi:hydrogenase maturation protease [candidate division WOR-3 bacterium]|nr:hydrogenase maturation protease [candidate division WOR-3 bacterium]
MKTLVLGIGNPILSDDGVGIKVVEGIEDRMQKIIDSGSFGCLSDMDVRQICIGGLSLLNEISGYNRLILIDSIKTGKGKPGDVYKLAINDLGSTLHLTSSHGMGFATVIELGRRLGCKIPETIEIFAVEVEDNTTFCEECTEKVKARIPMIVDEIMGMVEWM